MLLGSSVQYSSGKKSALFLESPLLIEQVQKVKGILHRLDLDLRRTLMNPLPPHLRKNSLGPTKPWSSYEEGGVRDPPRRFLISEGRKVLCFSSVKLCRSGIIWTCKETFLTKSFAWVSVTWLSSKIRFWIPLTLVNGGFWEGLWKSCHSDTSLWLTWV